MSPIDVNFHLQKSFESFIKNSAEKIQYKKDKGIKVPSPPSYQLGLNIKIVQKCPISKFAPASHLTLHLHRIFHYSSLYKQNLGLILRFLEILGYLHSTRIASEI